MKKEIKQTATKLTSLLTHVKMKGILPFKEKPSVNSFSASPESMDTKSQLNASELFSIFTADIIKKEVTFIR